MTDKEYLGLWRIARDLRSDYPEKVTVDIKSLPVGSIFFGLFPKYEAVPLVDHDSRPKIAIELFVNEYNKRHESQITVGDFVN